MLAPVPDKVKLPPLQMVVGKVTDKVGSPNTTTVTVVVPVELNTVPVTV